jgi:hypothetical protein
MSFHSAAFTRTGGAIARAVTADESFKNFLLDVPVEFSDDVVFSGCWCLTSFPCINEIYKKEVVAY